MRKIIWITTTKKVSLKFLVLPSLMSSHTHAVPKYSVLSSPLYPFFIEKRLVIEAESIIGDRTLWKNNLEMKNSFRISDDTLNVEDLLVLLGSIRHRQLTYALSCFDLTKKKTGKDSTYHV